MSKPTTFNYQDYEKAIEKIAELEEKLKQADEVIEIFTPIAEAIADYIATKSDEILEAVSKYKGVSVESYEDERE